MNNTLAPLSRPGRNYFWVRFQHPIFNESIRVELGRDLVEAQEICADLNELLTDHRTLKDDNSKLDRLHPKAVKAFFKPSRDRLRSLKKRKRLEYDELRLETVMLMLRTIELELKLVSKQIEWLWEVSEGRTLAIRRGWIDKEFGLNFLTKPEPVKEEYVPTKYLLRVTFPDGTLLYLRQEQDLDAFIKKLKHQFRSETCTTRYVIETYPDKRFLPELRALYGTSSGWFEVPSAPALDKRFKLIYRIRTKDGRIEYADGAVAYERLHATLRHKRKTQKCEISASAPDKLPSSWMEELARMFGRDESGFKIPFPDPPPKRDRRKFPCPKCGSNDVIWIQRLKTGAVRRKCTGCKNQFETT